MPPNKHFIAFSEALQSNEKRKFVPLSFDIKRLEINELFCIKIFLLFFHRVIFVAKL